MRDIDRVISSVRERLPDVIVWQHQAILPPDDDGLWWFALPGIEKNIQLESSVGTCPFLVEHDTERWHAASVEETVQAVVRYLQTLAGRR